MDKLTQVTNAASAQVEVIKEQIARFEKGWDQGANIDTLQGLAEDLKLTVEHLQRKLVDMYRDGAF